MLKHFMLDWKLQEAPGFQGIKDSILSAAIVPVEDHPAGSHAIEISGKSDPNTLYKIYDKYHDASNPVALVPGEAGRGTMFVGSYAALESLKTSLRLLEVTLQKEAQSKETALRQEPDFNGIKHQLLNANFMWPKNHGLNPNDFFANDLLAEIHGNKSTIRHILRFYAREDFKDGLIFIEQRGQRLFVCAVPDAVRNLKASLSGGKAVTYADARQTAY